MLKIKNTQSNHKGNMTKWKDIDLPVVKCQLSKMSYSLTINVINEKPIFYCLKALQYILQIG